LAPPLSLDERGLPVRFTVRAALIFITAAIASIIVTAYLSNTGDGRSYPRERMLHTNFRERLFPEGG
jgi:hypothetical protein